MKLESNIIFICMFNWRRKQNIIRRNSKKGSRNEIELNEYYNCLIGKGRWIQKFLDNYFIRNEDHLMIKKVHKQYWVNSMNIDENAFIFLEKFIFSFMDMFVFMFGQNVFVPHYQLISI